MALEDYSKTYKPFHYPKFMEAAVAHEKGHWHEEEVELGNDVEQWTNGTLNDAEKNQITQILRLFTQTDVQVGQNYCDLFIPIFKNNEVRCMLLSFAAREGIHQRSYALLNDTLGLSDEEYRAFLEYEEMAEKIEFMQQNDVSTKEGKALALAQTVCNEGMSLFSAFVMLLNYQRYGKMMGMCKIAEWSLRDETQHVSGAAELFLQYCKENKEVVNDDLKRAIYEMYRTAITLEDKFIDLVFEMGGTEGLEKEDVKKYIRYIADRRLNQLGLKANWHIKENPLPWLDWVLADGHTNFFEQRVSEYNVAGLDGDWGW